MKVTKRDRRFSYKARRDACPSSKPTLLFTAPHVTRMSRPPHRRSHVGSDRPKPWSTERVERHSLERVRLEDPPDAPRARLGEHYECRPTRRRRSLNLYPDRQPVDRRKVAQAADVAEGSLSTSSMRPPAPSTHSPGPRSATGSTHPPSSRLPGRGAHEAERTADPRSGRGQHPGGRARGLARDQLGQAPPRACATGRPTSPRSLDVLRLADAGMDWRRRASARS